MGVDDHTQQSNFLISNLKGLLQEKLWLLEERLNQKRMHTPYKTLTNAQVRVLATLRGEELTIAETARRLGISRQAVHKIVSQLVKDKLLKLQNIKGNSRDKQIVFTLTGISMKKEALHVLEQLENEVEKAIGPRQFKVLKAILQKEW
jgi:DNA-binding MarR family transcriptional regulator